jgi:hypothetical protein
LFFLTVRLEASPAFLWTTPSDRQRPVLQAAEEAGFDVLLTTDKNIRYQQNLEGRRIAIVVLGNPQRPAVHRHMDRVVAAANAATPGSYTEVEIPFD